MKTNPVRAAILAPNPLGSRPRPASAILPSLLILAWGSVAVLGQTVVVPGRLAATEGNTSSQTPSGDVPDGVRVMMFADSSQFGALTGPAYLTQFAYRPNAIPGPSGPRTTDFKIFAFTTTTALSALSTRFEANRTTQATLVFEGPLTLGSENLPGPGDTRQFDIRLPLTTPFLYDPADGNLAIEMQIGASSGNAFSWDAVTGDPAVRYLFNNGSPTAERGEFGVAPVLQFTFEPAPVVRIRTSHVEVCWTSVPNATYRVEWRGVSSDGDWASLVDCVRSAGDSTCVTDSVSGARPQRIYRVVRTDCTPQ